MKAKVQALWAFDFDGTLSEIVPERDAARLHPDCSSMLEELSARPECVVAVVSSRSLDDLNSRLPLSHVLKLGGSGLEWALPGGARVRPSHAVRKKLDLVRADWAETLERLQALPGVDLEDKRWSVAIHLRKVSEADRQTALEVLETLRRERGATFHRGPSVLEVQYLPGVSKAMAMRALTHRFLPEARRQQLFYAGDDENDAEAMRWVLGREGRACIVGERIDVPGASRVADPRELAEWVGRLSHPSSPRPRARAGGLRG